MNYINFISCGMTGDFIHCLSVVKNICQKKQSQANIYLTDNIYKYGGQKFRFGANKSKEDLFNTLKNQSFINKFEVITRDFNEPYINLNTWRNIKYRSWSDLLSNHYGYEIQTPYRWIDIDSIDMDTKDKIVIHRSLSRHNELFNWGNIIKNTQEEIIFITCSDSEYKAFKHKQNNVKLKLVGTIDDLYIAINSCKMFIGNQSLPFAIASSLDVNRLVELYDIDAHSYMNENKYSNNISWFLNDNDKYFNNNSLVKL